ncbi:MAG: Nramp family divalent metal transporter [Proteobacteria bacterium]|nr:Nramp family divalent metal transporter [Pseudomonadota bacterium]
MRSRERCWEWTEARPLNSLIGGRVVAPSRPWGPALPGPGRLGVLRRFLSFAGPGYLVAVGYMDPGNWATALSGGSAFGYSLLSVVLLSSVMAMFLQAAAVRLGLAGKMDLAQACRLHLHRRTSFLLWIACELAIVACNLAEVLGMACGLQLLLHIPLIWGVCLTTLDVLLVLQLRNRGARYLESLIIGLTALIAACLALQLWWLKPGAALFAGFIPSAAILSQPSMLYVAVAIMGATVMPHNLYLHSAIVRKGAVGSSLRTAIKYATWDSNLALSLALLVNAAIMILAAGAFHYSGKTSVTELSDAYHLLSPLLGVGAASTVFGLGLIASGLSSSITGTLAGQIVMEGFLDMRVSRTQRALWGRLLAIVPAFAVALWVGESGIGKALVFTQVVLGLQLPFAVVPLLWFTTRSRFVGAHAFKRSTAILLWSVAVLVIAGNACLLLRLL